MHNLKYQTKHLVLEARLVPWDTKAFGFVTADLNHLRVIDEGVSIVDFTEYFDWLERNEVRFISARLPHHRLEESFLLEEADFRFIEMVLHPTFEDLRQMELNSDELHISSASPDELPALADITGSAFQTERFHVDPRIDVKLADTRYRNWVIGAATNPDQHLLKVEYHGECLAVFIVEYHSSRYVSWLLTAITPKWQGRGFGYRIWMCMLAFHRSHGFRTVTTTISARNVRVLNLYSKLNARFLVPEMTFHCLRNR